MCRIIEGIHNGSPFRAFECKGDPDERLLAMYDNELPMENDEEYLNHIACVDSYLESGFSGTLEEFEHGNQS